MITKDKIGEFKALTEPVMKWLLDNGTPHDKIIIDCMNAKLSEGSIGVPSDYNVSLREVKCCNKVKSESIIELLKRQQLELQHILQSGDEI